MSILVLIFTEQALISLETSKSSSLPLALRYLDRIVPKLIKFIGFSTFNSSLIFIYSSKEFLIILSSSVFSSKFISKNVLKVVCLQWSDQYVSRILISVSLGSLFSDLKYSLIHFKSSRFIASDFSSRKFSSSPSLKFINPS